MHKIKKILIFLFFCLISVFIYQYSSSLFIARFDEGYNLQIPLSLNENFVYQSRYEPRKIADYRITVGYPQHYFQAILFKIFGVNLETVRLYSTLAFLALLLLSYLYTKSFLTAIYLFSFYLITSWFKNDVSRYYGEITTINFLILSAFFLEKYEQINKKRKNYTLLILSSLLFSLAVSNKIISLLAIFLIFSIYKINLKEKIVFLFNSLLFYTASYIFIISYSYFLKLKTLVGFKGFLINYKDNFLNTIFINSSKIPLSFQNLIDEILVKINQFEGGNLNLLVIFVLPLIFLIIKGNLLFSIASLFILMKIFLTMFWRHYLIFLIFLFLLMAKKINKNKVYSYLIILVSIINIFNFVFFISKSHFSEIKLNNINKEKQKEFTKKFDQINGEIYTNGWWQNPDITFYTKKFFRDRMAFNQINDKNTNLLLSFSYQGDAWPFTDLNKLCGDVIYCEKTYILCRLKKGVYFNDLSEKNKETKKCPKFKFD